MADMEVSEVNAKCFIKLKTLFTYVYFDINISVLGSKVHKIIDV